MKHDREMVKTIPLKNVYINGSFWADYIELVRKEVVPYQWDALNDNIPDIEPSHAIRNFKIAAGMEKGEFHGMVFQDSDVAKWLEAVGYLLAREEDAELEQRADEVIEIISNAQREDGYLNTYFILKEPGREWTNLCECHELYCAGHMIEAGAAYYQATGKTKLLQVAVKFADHIYEVFGPEEGQTQGYDGHQEIELALVKLYEVTLDEKYLQLSRFFLLERGKQPHFYDIEAEKRNGSHHFPGKMMIEDKSYSQAHALVTEQKEAAGHAVRFAYMCTGMAHVADKYKDEKLLAACRRLWRNVVDRQMYITGAVGSQSYGESFTIDYDLPNDTAYAETCASIGLIFFANRMLQIEPDREYADVLERALYNTVLAGMSMDGKEFFYVNPLEVEPQAAEESRRYDHVAPVRQGWLTCACCPPNVARLIASLGQYIYTVMEETIYTHLYISSDAKITLNNKEVLLSQQTNYPWDGNVEITVTPEAEAVFALALRVPAWSEEVELFINDQAQALPMPEESGYILLSRKWKPGDKIRLQLSLPIMLMQAHPRVRHAAGKTAVQRGPVVYCLEEADNGANLHNIFLQSSQSFNIKEGSEHFRGLKIITGEGNKKPADHWGEKLYKAQETIPPQTMPLTFIPYFSWANRGRGEMKVWIQTNI
ncbi:glycoside hydrolase family 127 protein [Alkalicoccus daliensis]|uniref:Glycoside hydrolase family 127 protein n=1 Tax=Alkalicoccus daliensis TaxID=745820 RepID=A0A1H0HGW9_9BACI|nr:beta-L-arabinofuranosidase domain-containing protein [Alkalicoccus daliensis]SDO18340.1 hypothetical protein SAMN04488053_10896 [Alkalicoccus daliensis]